MAFPVRGVTIVFLGDTRREPALTHDNWRWSNDDGRGMHNHWRRLDDHGLQGHNDGSGSDHHWLRERHPDAHGYLDPPGVS
jgi:hypothetical protein